MSQYERQKLMLSTEDSLWKNKIGNLNSNIKGSFCGSSVASSKDL